MATRRNRNAPGQRSRVTREVAAAEGRLNSARAAGMTTTEAYRSMNAGRSAPARRASAIILRDSQTSTRSTRASARRAGMDPGTR